ncbi:MAG: cyclic nucleotide-binding domain-containing protein [Myxococcales bacterium]|nr:cyclic nucleotide-binding domain-containing protein [Myxococcales bacterium]
MKSRPAELAVRIREQKDRAEELCARSKLAAARAAYQEVLLLDPGDVTTRRRVADLCVRLGDPAGAIEQYLALVGRLVTEGAPMQAIAIARVILQIDPGHTEAQRVLGALLDGSSRDRTSLPPPMRRALTASIIPPPLMAPADLDGLRRIPLFSELGRRAFLDLLPHLERRVVVAGEVIAAEGEVGDAMYAIVAGTVRVERAEGGAVRPIAELGEGAFFGEMSLLTRAPRFATVVATTQGELLVLRREAFEDLVRGHAHAGTIVRRFCRARLLSNLLRAAPMFEGLQAEDRARLVEALEVRTCEAGSEILRQGERPEHFYVLLRGRCEVLHHTPEAARAMPDMHEGAFFGEIALLTGEPATATVRCAVPCVVAAVPRQVLLSLLHHRKLLVALAALGEKRLTRTREALASDIV